MNKPELLENQTAHYFTVSSIDFEKSYKTMDMRIAKGFSDRELSFLLGYHPLYVRDVENPLHSKRYKARDTNYLLHIFNCTLPEILDGKLEELTYKLFVVATSNSDGTKSYDIFKEEPNGKHKIFRSFTELPAFKAVGVKSVASPIMVKDFILDLLDEGYFSEPKTGLELFRTCVKHFKGHVRPFFITNAFKLIHKMDGRSIKVSKNEMKRFVYSE
ncbi:hypothetical protein [Pedobacter sp.]|uniref:hypothetical protein n=1 Tax=Pedobacter sp. TaxID=1411316 RepID=UPI002C400F9F|nr:hypothetical protein [Pedobacter sp.]HWW38050.1 hypothetical protein [Pedobacter sp.]